MAEIRHEFDLSIPEKFAGSRLDKALACMCGEFSRAQLTRWIRDGSILVDGRQTKPNTTVEGAERVVLRAPGARQEDWHEPQSVDFEVVFEDPDIIVVDKPPGLVVHPGAGNPDGTLVNGLLHRRGDLADLPRGGIVHRLDKNTSGLLVVAASDRAHRVLTAAIADRSVGRYYAAVCEGRLERPFTIDKPIGRDSRDRTRQRVRDDGRPAITRVRPLERYRAHSLVEARLETGRTHQVRVHMASLGHPLVGDRRYGARGRLPKAPSDGLIAEIRGFARQALHARRLTFEHPTTGAALEFESPIPADMQALVDALRQDEQS